MLFTATGDTTGTFPKSLNLPFDRSVQPMKCLHIKERRDPSFDVPFTIVLARKGLENHSFSGP